MPSRLLGWFYEGAATFPPSECWYHPAHSSRSQCWLVTAAADRLGMAVAGLNSCLHSGDLNDLFVITVLSSVSAYNSCDLKAVHLLGKPHCFRRSKPEKTASPQNTFSFKKAGIRSSFQTLWIMLLSELSFVSLPFLLAEHQVWKSLWPNNCMNYLRRELIFFGHCSRSKHDSSTEDCFLEFHSSIL